MLPASTGERTQRAVSRGRPDGRTVEIQRLIGRALRAVCDFEALGERTLWLDCDVLQADGGTRCASITGAWIAAARALDRFGLSKALTGSIAAVSVGIVGGEAVLDLDYEEDSSAETDMNVVMTGDGRLVEVQATAERDPFSRELLDELLDLAAGGIDELTAAQLEAAAAAASRREARSSRRATRTSCASSARALPDWEIELLDAPRTSRSRTGRRSSTTRASRRARPAPRAGRRLGRRRGLGHRGRGARRTAGVESARWASDGVARLLAELDGVERPARPVRLRARRRSTRTASELRASGNARRRDRARARAGPRASATTRSSSRSARRRPSPSSGTPGRPSTPTARERRASSPRHSRVTRR